MPQQAGHPFSTCWGAVVNKAPRNQELFNNAIAVAVVSMSPAAFVAVIAVVNIEISYS